MGWIIAVNLFKVYLNIHTGFAFINIGYNIIIKAVVGLLT